MKTVFVVLVVVGVVAGGAAYYVTLGSTDAPAIFRTATVKRADLVATIIATGTVEPEEVVDVGAQVAGKIERFGPDTRDPNKSIDYGSIVENGTMLAEIDDSVYKAQFDQSEALLQRAKADLLQLEAKCDQTLQERKRAEVLRPQKAIADTDYDLTVANYKVAKANVEIGKAAIKQAEATLRLAKTNLDYTIIKSPVRGVIVDRRVNVGQTVVASLNAPSIFLIAKDLRRILVWASVNEADIGRIHPDMPVRFTVDAYPGETFKGKVLQIRLNATMTQNVVTYTVVVVTDNTDGRLLPYLTANLQFETDQHPDVLQVPNAALRWKPTRPSQIAPDARETAKQGSSGKRGGDGKAPGGKPSGDAKPAKPVKEREDRGRLWVQDGDFVRPIEVQTGITDGSTTEVSGGDLKEGVDVVIGEVVASDDAADTTNPFAPKLFRGGKH